MTRIHLINFPHYGANIYTIKNYNNRTGYYTFEGLDKQFKYNDLQKIDINNLMSFNVPEGKVSIIFSLISHISNLSNPKL